MKVFHATLEDIQKHAIEVLEPHFHMDDTHVIKVSLIVVHQDLNYRSKEFRLIITNKV